MSGTRPAGAPSARSTSRAATSPASTGWNRKPDGTGITGSLASWRHGRQGQVVELGGAQRRPGQAGVGHDLLGGQLGGEVAEHGAVDGAGDRDPVGADDRDVDQVPGPGPGRRPDQVPGLDLVALGAAGAVHDDLGALDRGVDPLAGGQVAGHVLDARRRPSRRRRLSTRTSHPASRSRGTTSRPRVPVPPVTRMGDGMSWLPSAPCHIGRVCGVTLGMTPGAERM